jgi:hypothetical protein
MTVDEIQRLPSSTSSAVSRFWWKSFPVNKINIFHIIKHMGLRKTFQYLSALYFWQKNYIEISSFHYNLVVLFLILILISIVIQHESSP